MDASTKKLIKTFLIIIVIMILLFAGFFIFVGLSTRLVGNDRLLTIMENAAISYYQKNDSKLPENNGKTEVSTSTLISEGYMKPFDKLTKNKNCSGKVLVTNNNGTYLYSPSLKCDEYSTKYLVDRITSSIVSSGDGLYNDGNIYYYKGEYPNNYIKFGDNLYRIISIDEYGVIKVYDPNLSRETYSWDDRYNSERDQYNFGINDYEKSRIRESLNTIYDSLNENIKKYIIKYNWCIGSRTSTDSSFETDECSNTIEDYLRLITANEYVRPSLDEECTNIYSGSCTNYNYLVKDIDKNIWTPIRISDNTYEVLAIVNNDLTIKRASVGMKNMVIFNISGNNIYVSGNGTNEEPYVIK